MFRFKHLRFIGALTSVALTFSGIGLAEAAPVRMAPSATLAPESSITDVRAKRVVRHRAVRRNNNAGAAAVFGMFGTLLGAAIANDRYDDYSYYSYGYTNGYGYAPSYSQGPVYRGNVRGYYGQQPGRYGYGGHRGTIGGAGPCLHR